MVLIFINSYQVLVHFDQEQIYYNFSIIIFFLIAVSFFSDISKFVVQQTKIYLLKVNHFYRLLLKNISKHQEYLNFLILVLNIKNNITSFLCLLSLLLTLCLLLFHSLSLQIFLFLTSFFILFLLTAHIKCKFKFIFIFIYIKNDIIYKLSNNDKIC